MELKSRYLKEFIQEITYKNRNPQNVKALELLDDLSTNPECIIPMKTKLYRCRIIKDESKINISPNFYGLDAENSFVPPAKTTRDLRANYKYIPYLYCSSTPYIAMLEVRPRFGAKVNMATIIAKEDLRLLDFTNGKKPSKMTEAKINLFSDLSAVFSKPIKDDDDIIDYIPTQFIAEYVKHLGYDGLMYRSSLEPGKKDQEIEGYNIVVFNYKKCEAAKSNVYSITTNAIDCIQVDKDPERLEIKSDYLQALEIILGKPYCDQIREEQELAYL